VAEHPIRGGLESQIDWWWKALFRRRLEGLTDEELWWKPVEDAWTVRRGDDGQMRYEWPPGSRGEAEPPFTTLAWRLCHLTLTAMAPWAMGLEGDRQYSEHGAELTFPDTAAEVIALVEHWWERWRAGLGRLDDAALLGPISASAYTVGADVMRLGQDDPLLNYLLHQQREFIHHGAEVNLLRDLYRSTGAQVGVMPPPR
jgi:hypothetical protein